MSVISDLVDTTRYPIDLDPNSPEYTSLIHRCQAQLADVGNCDLEGFIRADAIKDMAAEVQGLPSFNRLQILGPFLFEKFDKAVGSDHPSQRQFAQDTHVVAGDQIPTCTMLRRVYESPLVLQFLRLVLNRRAMYKLGDEFQCINVMYMHDGCSRAWHYDGTEAVITLMLQDAEAGGEFEWAPFIRGESGDERFDDVAKLFAGKYKNVHLKSARAGTLNLFNGKRSMHRVRTVYGPVTRTLAVLSYDDIPDRTFPTEKNCWLYGERVRQIYRERGLINDVLEDKRLNVPPDSPEPAVQAKL